MSNTFLDDQQCPSDEAARRLSRDGGEAAALLSSSRISAVQVRRACRRVRRSCPRRLRLRRQRQEPLDVSWPPLAANSAARGRLDQSGVLFRGPPTYSNKCNLDVLLRFTEDFGAGNATSSTGCSCAPSPAKIWSAVARAVWCICSRRCVFIIVPALIIDIHAVMSW